MLNMKSTPNHTGVKVSGDYFDLDELNVAIYKMIGQEDQYYGYEGSRMRILNVAYQIRQAAQGDRNVDFVFNGLHEHTMKQHGLIAPDKNIYFSTEILWPELIYAAIALKDFVNFYQEDKKFPLWDVHLPTIFRFQSLVLDCLQGHVPAEEFDVILKAFNQPASVNDYAIQYVDLLNLKYIGMTKEQREKSLSTIAMKIAVQDQDYTAFRNQVIAAATPYKKPIHEIDIKAEYPEKFEW
ncbi:hypothetical protein FQ085_04985 [Planococcus sp. ANT_H30]|uniref:DUF6904 family protein n=1 Tax=Planococcus sp. ANT_H30 TaxID=2597347 RepID=UPI0011EDF073|nr:hypothetical protein [Planococcus sp. ANT_H30]KAA0959076.1 hypothetical protein FQ085_04985 [Planococcus sp. ANT_H30]